MCEVEDNILDVIEIFIATEFKDFETVQQKMASIGPMKVKYFQFVIIQT